VLRLAPLSLPRPKNLHDFNLGLYISAAMSDNGVGGPLFDSDYPRSPPSVFLFPTLVFYSTLRLLKFFASSTLTAFPTL